MTFTYEEALEIKAEVAALRVSCDELEAKADAVLEEHGVLIHAEVSDDGREIHVVLHEVDCPSGILH